MKPNNEKSKLTKKQKIWIVVAFILVLIVIITTVVVIHYHQNKNTINSSPSSVNSQYFETKTNTNPEKEGISGYKGDDIGNEDEEKEELAQEKAEYANKQNYYKDPDGTPAFITGVAKYTIPNVNPNPNYYYFEDGKWNSNYTGLADDFISGNLMYYVKNGIVDTQYIGFATNDGFSYYVKNGKIQRNFSGKLILNGKTYHITNGVDDASR